MIVIGYVPTRSRKADFPQLIVHFISGQIQETRCEL